jgi:general stress protein YciG
VVILSGDGEHLEAAMLDETKTTEDPASTAKPLAPEPPADAPKKRRGFAAMDRTLLRAISRKGGVAAHERGTAHCFTQEEARDAGRKGGRAPHRTRGKSVPPVASTEEPNAGA